MVESEAQQLSEEVMLGAVVFGHEQGNVAINAIHELVREAGKPVWDWQPRPRTRPSKPASRAGRGEDPRRLPDPQQAGAHQALREAGASVQAALKEQGVEFDPIKVDNLVFDIEARVVRSQILSGEPRIDGRDTRTVRPIEIRTGVLPRTTAPRCSRAARPRPW